MTNDLRYAVRTLRAAPGFTSAAVLTLAIGIGANSAVFSVVNALLLRPLPFAHAERIALIWNTRPREGPGKLGLSQPNIDDIRRRSRSFEAVSAAVIGRATITGGEPETVQVAYTSSNLLAILGVQPAIGRRFTPDEETRRTERVAILSHALWQRRFAGDPSIAAKSVSLDGSRYQIVGVLPPTFRFLSSPQETDVWLPLGLDPFVDRRYARAVHAMGAIGLLRPGVSFEQAQEEMNGLSAQLEHEYPGDNRGRRIMLVSLRDQAVQRFKPSVLVLMGAVGLVLLIACANVANLLMARASARRREFAIRAVLGAARARLARQLLIEYVLLAIIGGVTGLFFAWWTLDLLPFIPLGGPDPFTPYRLLRNEIRIDRVVLGFTTLVSLGAGALFGLAPALGASRANLGEWLRDAGPSTIAGTRVRARALLVMAELALSLMLAIGAGLLIRSLVRLQQVDPGFSSENVLSFDVKLPPRKYSDPPAISSFYDDALERIRTVHGVTAVGASEFLPLSGADSAGPFFIEGRAQPSPGEERRTHYRTITADYLSTMGIRLVGGRSFSDRDTADSPRVALINQTMARRYWPGEDPLGRRIAVIVEALRFRSDGPPTIEVGPALRQIVGVVADVRHESLRAEAFPEMYIPFRQRPVRDLTVVARTSADPQQVVSDVRHAVLAADPNQPIANVTTLGTLLSSSLAPSKFSSLLLSIFAAIAVALALVGVYGITSYTVSQRTREIGIRVALGGQTQDIAALVLRGGLMMTLGGLVLGLAGAFAVGRVMSSLLFAVEPTDAVAFTGASIVLGLVALAGTWLPSRRALRVDPVVALRQP